MAVPIEITFRSMEPSPAVEAVVQTWANRLEHYCDRIERCSVVIEIPHRRHRRWKTFQVRIFIAVPERTIAITRDAGIEQAHADVYVALGDAFHAARRALQDHTRIHRGEVKLHA